MVKVKNGATHLQKEMTNIRENLTLRENTALQNPVMIPLYLIFRFYKNLTTYKILLNTYIGSYYNFKYLEW